MIAALGTISRADAPSADGLAEKELIAAAMQSYRYALACYETNTVKHDEVFGWSVRWMQAELRASATAADRAKAIEAHLRRLLDMQERINSSQASDLAYYVIEAELLLRAADPQAKARLDQQALARREFQGRWQLLDGDDAEQPQDAFITISGRILSRGDREHESPVGLIDVDPTQSPKRIRISTRDDDLIIDRVGIYRVVDGVLSICWSGSALNRPHEFSDTGGNKLVRYKRIPPTK